MNTKSSLDTLDKHLNRIFIYTTALEQAKNIEDLELKFKTQETIKFKIRVLKLACNKLIKYTHACDL